MLLASPGFAQSQGIVTVDRAVIWRTDSSVVAAVVDAGLVLELTGRSDRWYEVVIPASLGGRGERGLIAVTQIRLLDQSVEPIERQLPGNDLPNDDPLSGLPPLPPQPRGPATSFRAFVQAGLIGFAARESFTAVTGESFGPSVGGGVEARFRAGLYLQLSLERYKQTGQRVFVFGGEVFPLGVPNTVTIEPLTASVGYRPPTSLALQPYVGGGFGSYRLREVSPFDTANEEVDERHLGYHVHGGLELRTRWWVAPAVEVRYSTVPDSLGTGGAAAAFAESDLGGWQFAARLLIGR